MKKFEESTAPPFQSPGPPELSVAEIRQTGLSRRESAVGLLPAILRRVVVYFAYVLMITLAVVAGSLFVSHGISVNATVLAFALLAAYPALLDLCWRTEHPMRALLAYLCAGLIVSVVLWIALGATNVVWLAAASLAAIVGAPGFSSRLRKLLEADSVAVNRAQFLGTGILPLLYGVYVAYSAAPPPPLGLVPAVRLLAVLCVIWFLIEPAMQFRDVEDRLMQASEMPLSAEYRLMILDMTSRAEIGRGSPLVIAREQLRHWSGLVIEAPILLAVLMFLGGLDVIFLAVTAVSFGLLVIGTLDFAHLMGSKRGLLIHRALRQQWVFALLMGVIIGASNVFDLGLAAKDLPQSWVDSLARANITGVVVLVGSLYGILQSASNPAIKPYWRRRAQYLSAAAAIAWLASMVSLLAATTLYSAVPVLARNLGRLIALDIVSVVGLFVALGVLTFVCFSPRTRYPSHHAHRGGRRSEPRA